MPIEWSIDESKGVVRMTHTGASDFPTWSQAMTDVIADSRFRPGLGFQVDMDGSEVPTSDHQREVLHFLTTHSAELAGSRWAYVAPTAAHFGMARMVQLMADTKSSLPIAVFRTLTEATDWLVTKAET